MLKNERLSLILATYQRNLELTEQKLVAAQQENIDLHIQIKQLVQNSSQLQHQLKDLSNSGKNQAPSADPEFHVEGQSQAPSAAAAAAAVQQKEMQEQQQQQYMTMYAALTEQIKELKDHIQLSAIAAVSPGRVSKTHSAAAQGKAYSSILALFGYITLLTVSAYPSLHSICRFNFYKVDKFISSSSLLDLAPESGEKASVSATMSAQPSHTSLPPTSSSEKANLPVQPTPPATPPRSRRTSSASAAAGLVNKVASVVNTARGTPESTTQNAQVYNLVCFDFF